MQYNIATMKLLCYQYYLLLLLFLFVSPSSSQSKTKFSDCARASISCGGDTWNISYPFRLPGMPSYCGHRNFELQCIRDMLQITISKKAYRVTAMRYDIQFITLSCLDSWRDSCPLTFSNPSVDSSLFNYASTGMNLTMFFNCSPLTPTPNIKIIPCLSSNSGNQSYYSLPDDPPRPAQELYKKCGSIVLIPMFKNMKDSLVKGRVDFLGVLQDGFGLNWVVGNGWCRECTDSGGVCGSDPDYTNAPACFCNHGRATNGICPGIGSINALLETPLRLFLSLSLKDPQISDFYGWMHNTTAGIVRDRSSIQVHHMATWITCSFISLVLSVC